MRPSIIIAAALAAGLSAPASAEDAYVVGITAALTGPPASTYAPAVEAPRLYLERMNAAGGVNGKKVRLSIENDSAQPSKAAANAKKLLDNPVLMLNASLSSTYAPVIAEAKTAGVPLMFASSVCPKDVYPPAVGIRLTRSLKDSRAGDDGGVCVTGTLALIPCGLIGTRSGYCRASFSLGCPSGPDRGSWSCEASAILGRTG
jgi:Periplasmic binding protein